MRWSNVASSNGRVSADDSTSSTRVPNRSRARASISALWSTPRAGTRGGEAPLRRVRSRCDVEDVPSVTRDARDERRQRGSWPKESTAPTRSYDGPSGANSSWRRRTARRLLCDMALADEQELCGCDGEGTPGRRCRLRCPCDRAETGRRVYLCSLDGADATRAWIGVRDGSAAVTSRAEVRAAVSIAALCEVAVDTAGRRRHRRPDCELADLRMREAPEGIEDAEAAARAARGSRRASSARLAGAARRDRLGDAPARARARSRRGVALLRPH